MASCLSAGVDARSMHRQSRIREGPYRFLHCITSSLATVADSPYLDGIASEGLPPASRRPKPCYTRSGRSGCLRRHMMHIKRTRPAHSDSIMAQPWRYLTNCERRLLDGCAPNRQQPHPLLARLTHIHPAICSILGKVATATPIELIDRRSALASTDRGFLAASCAETSPADRGPEAAGLAGKSTANRGVVAAGCVVRPPLTEA